MKLVKAIFLTSFCFAIGLLFIHWILLPFLKEIHASQHKRNKTTHDCQKFITESTMFWMHSQYTFLDIPESVIQDIINLPVEAHTINIDNVLLHYKESKPLAKKNDLMSVLLLHGASFSSATWSSLGTIKFIAAFGYRAVAIDLPGFGKTPRISVPNKEKFLENLIAALKLENLVIISPSMSGLYSIPYLFKNWENMSGFVPISPVLPKSLSSPHCRYFRRNDLKNMSPDPMCLTLITENDISEDFSCIKIPILVVHGEKDAKESSGKMCKFPFSKAVIIHDGSHSPYLTNPALWHKILYNFLISAHMMQKCKYFYL